MALTGTAFHGLQNTPALADSYLHVSVLLLHVFLQPRLVLYAFEDMTGSCSNRFPAIGPLIKELEIGEIFCAQPPLLLQVIHRHL